MAQSGYGKIRLFTDFAGAEIPVANAVAYGTTAGGCNYYIGEFKVVGDLAETDTGLVSVDKSGGWARIGGNESTTWHAVANGGSTTGATASTTTTTGVLAVAAVSQVLRVEIDPNGTARWYIDGKLVRTLAGAVSTTVLQGALVGSWGTTTTATSIDADYFAVEANRDWTI
jgi:hypothetical protein